MRKKTSITITEEDKELLKVIGLDAETHKGTVSAGINELCKLYRRMMFIINNKK